MASGPEPLFTVVVPVRNGGATLERALRSVLAQTFQDCEVIVVDDGSTDGSADVARTFVDPRLRVISRPAMGEARARNHGIRCARGRFVTFLDADDEALPRWLETFASLAPGGASVLRCGAILLGPDGLVRDVTFPAGPEKLGLWLRGFLPGTYAVRSDLLTDLGGFDPTFRFALHTEIAFRLRAAIGSADEVAVAPNLLIRKHWSGGDARYGAARAEAALTLLQRFRRQLRSAPRLRADYLTVAAVEAARGDRWARTTWMLLRAWVCDPLALRRLARLVAACVPHRRVRALVGRGARVDPRPPAEMGGSLPPPRAKRDSPPMVSVVIPVRNSANTLDRQLRALSMQTYSGTWEVVVADNGSRDGLASVIERWARSLPRLRVVDAGPEPNVSRARNTGTRAADGSLILVCDADDEVSPRWVEAMAQAAQCSDLVGGPLAVARLNPPNIRQARSVSGQAIRPDPLLPWVAGANCGVWKDVWHAVGGWDESVRGSDDIDFSWRVQLAGFRLGSAPAAVVHYSFRCGRLANLRQSLSYGRARARLYRRYGRVGMSNRRLVPVFKSWLWTLVHVPDVFSGDPARTFWLRHLGSQLGRLIGSIEQRVLYL